MVNAISVKLGAGPVCRQNVRCF